ncbi:hypothetical protein BB561_004997 [Smittium simulii]|uniref:triacylglycerol lipase n=1 Tax=Smittium simulii TaxID=133385 RepID=A0A2T9YCW5_9FUNG|nr:hypothetical protein BB561_004997 [Smittium simulii]
MPQDKEKHTKLKNKKAPKSVNSCESSHQECRDILPSKNSSKFSMFKKLILSAVIACCALVLLLKITSNGDTSHRKINRRMSFNKRDEEPKALGGIFLRDIYEQERPNQEAVEKIVEKLATQQKNPKFRGAPADVISNDDISRLKKVSVNKGDLDKKFKIESSNTESSGKRFRSLDTGFSLKVLNENQIDENFEKTTNSNGRTSKFRGLAMDTNNNKEETSASSKPKLNNASELEKLSSQFRDGEVGEVRSFWSDPKAEAKEEKQDAQKKKNFRFFQLFTEFFASGEKADRKAAEQWKFKDNYSRFSVPDVSDKGTLISLAQMAANAYSVKDSSSWEKLGKNWKTDMSIGWESDGLRGYTFVTEKNDTVVISLKGTSASLFMVGAEATSYKDKLNDNRLFSCCCGAYSGIATQPCKCATSRKTCSSSCLEKSLKVEDSYFVAASRIVTDVLKQYPKSNVILTGHSLGGSVASIVALAFGLPAVVFATPGDMMAAKRLKLPLPKGKSYADLPIYHIANNSDVIFLGQCNGINSSCFYGGYSMETKCHIGKECIFDTAKHLKWVPDVLHHRMTEYIDYVLVPWVTEIKGTKMPRCRANTECKECPEWTYE